MGRRTRSAAGRAFDSFVFSIALTASVTSAEWGLAGLGSQSPGGASAGDGASAPVSQPVSQSNSPPVSGPVPQVMTATKPSGNGAPRDGATRNGATHSPTPDLSSAPASGPSAAEPATASDTSAGAGGFAIRLCPAITISNRPAEDGDGNLRGARRYVNVDGVKVLSYPLDGPACFSSGFGPRDGSPHKGIDYGMFGDGSAPTVLAAAAGTIVQQDSGQGFGNFIVIDHGAGVHTVYAHLASFAGGTRVGASVREGQPLGPMGDTQAGAVHLHYEVRTGTFSDAAGVFGLAEQDPLGFPFAD